MIFNDAILEKKYFHKRLQENVFIINLRRSLPVYFDKDTVEKNILPQLSSEYQALFLEYYQFHSPENSGIFNENNFSREINDKECYVIFNIPHELKSELLNSTENSLRIPLNDRGFLLDCYIKKGKSNIYRLKKNLGEIEGKKIQDILNGRDIFITNSEKMLLSQIIESVEKLKKEDVFYGNMIINRNHSFFFEHPQEHVPGMMVLEAARQIVTACAHIYGRIPLKGYQFILNQLSSEFFDYIELNYTIGMSVELSQLELEKNSQWATMGFKITAFQKNKICAVIEIDGKSISKKLFSRLRVGYDDTNPIHRFYPINPEICPIFLWSGNKKYYFMGKLVDLSYKGFCVRSDEKLYQAEETEYEFTMHFPEIGFFHGYCGREWVNSENGAFYVGFHMTITEKADLSLLKEAIKRFCHIRIDRGESLNEGYLTGEKLFL